MTITETFLERISSAYFRLFGSAKLLAHEAACLTAWRRHLDSVSRSSLDAQLAEVDLVQRTLRGRIVTFHRVSGGRTARAFAIRERVARVFKLQIRAANKMWIRAAIVVADGYLSSLEFNETPSDVGLIDSSAEELELSEETVLVNLQGG